MYNTPTMLEGYRDAVFNVPELALAYIEKHGPTDKLEKCIAKDPLYSKQYAVYILKGRFQPGEKAIAKLDYTSYEYAKHALKGRFELGEDAIAQNPSYSLLYASLVLKGRFKKGEPLLEKTPFAACSYAMSVLNHRWPEAEPGIIKLAHTDIEALNPEDYNEFEDYDGVLDKIDMAKRYFKHFGIEDEFV